ncbi:hypothetical protein [Domibacillus aminovorans]|uniref:Uncharacterized protein n=1 Tax=Domibacillus aminovorans TaxID=29332 RepID=A0A177L474_9BACI|nr:hypothetical protein [Domibacillus aminovorans]OAH60105.1 hypothetical protein AWH49_18040 [Domibacillus aminovorans]
MVVKKSANVGQIVERMLSDEDLSVNQIAFDLDVSPQMASHLKNNRRTMQQDIAKRAINVYNDSPAFVMDLLFEFSDGYTSPVLRGKALEQHRLSFKEFLADEWADVQRKVYPTEKDDLEYKFDWKKAPENATKEEVAWIKDLIIELNEAEMAVTNFRRHLYEAYLINPKQVQKETFSRIKTKGWIEV